MAIKGGLNNNEYINCGHTTNSRLCVMGVINRCFIVHALQDEIPVEEVQVIHRYRPYTRVNGSEPKYQGFSRHVGSILKSKEFVDYYNKESKCGLQA